MPQGLPTRCALAIHSAVNRICAPPPWPMTPLAAAPAVNCMFVLPEAHLTSRAAGNGAQSVSDAQLGPEVRRQSRRFAACDLAELIERRIEPDAILRRRYSNGI